MNRIVAGSLRPIALGLSTLYAGIAGWHVWVDDFAPHVLIVSLAAGSSVSFGIVWNLLRKRKIDPHLAHPVGAALFALVMINGTASLISTGDPRQTTTLMLAILGAGVLFLDRGWFFGVVVAGSTGWVSALVLSSGARTGSWVYFGLTLTMATALSALVQHLRVKTTRNIEGLHGQDRIRQIELETALARTEAARATEYDTRKELEDAVRDLSATEERFRRLSEATFEGILIHRDGRLLDANPRAAKLLGRKIEEMIDLDIREFVADESREAMRGFMLRSPGSLEDRFEEIQMVRTDGTSFPALISGRPVLFERGHAVVAVFRDISDRKRAEDLLQRVAEQAEANSRMKSTFLTNMSHELRTPLNAVIGFANILSKNSGGRLNEKDLDFVGRIASSGYHLNALISDILDLSRIEAGRLEVVIEPVEMGIVVEEVRGQVELDAKRKGLTLTKSVPQPLQPFEADRGRIQQILVNLLGNAIKFTEKGGVEIRIESDDDSVPCKIHIVDTGIGIPVERIWTIFDAFQQAESSTARRHEGQGLGLTITRSLCDLMGYELSVESVVGEGSTFTVDLNPRSRRLGDSSGREHTR
jgi:PAS domain S-box-containing protein